jgi:pantoate--beta-alanine ligase
MEIFREVGALRAFVESRRRAGDRIGLVPTMGCLHEGHISLARRALQSAQTVVVSIFVNPTQFGPREDLETYPRDEAGDLARCREEGVAAVFLPAVGEMYPLDPIVTVNVSKMTRGLCGASRPDHFQGVTTVVTKLFQIVMPDVAVFGRKDYQQLVVLRRMVSELHMPVEVVGVPTVREEDGLALSSRNAYLSGLERRDASALSRALGDARAAVEAGTRDCGQLIESARGQILRAGSARIDYIEIVHPKTLAPLAKVGADGAMMCVAVFIGETRLIDNICLDQGDS